MPYNILWNKMSAFNSPPSLSYREYAFTDHSVSHFSNKKLGWGGAPNIAPRVPKVFSELPEGPGHILSLRSPWNELCQTELSRQESDRARIYFSPVKSMFGDIHSITSKERKHLIKMRKANCHGRQPTCRKQKLGPDLVASWTSRARKVWEAMSEFGLQCFSHILSHSERDLVSHVYPVEQWFSKTARAITAPASLENC